MEWGEGKEKRNKKARGWDGVSGNLRENLVKGKKAGKPTDRKNCLDAPNLSGNSL